MSRLNDRGFTLLEAVVALAILGLASVAALSALAAELRSAERAQRALEAAALAQDRLAALELLSVEDLSPLPDSLRRGRFGAPFTAYAWEAAVREVPGDQGLVDAAVRVEWEGGAYPLHALLYRPRPRTVPR
ncbi:MAG TPA: type II secretion system protein [Longimicrobiaceae bacterium]|nr:type II secretion system protein [Longimicrobiaceae bacterium]